MFFKRSLDETFYFFLSLVPRRKLTRVFEIFLSRKDWTNFIVCSRPSTYRPRPYTTFHDRRKLLKNNLTGFGNGAFEGGTFNIQRPRSGKAPKGGELKPQLHSLARGLRHQIEHVTASTRFIIPIKDILTAEYHD